VRFVVIQPQNNSIVVRGPQALMDQATRFVETLDAARPQVMLEMQVFQVSSSMAKALGIDLPKQWEAFSVGQQALDLLQQPNVQDLINQLIASGGINQANSTAIAALLAQLQAQQSSIFQQPFATFGGGSTLFAVPFPTASVNFSANDSFIQLLERLDLRASQGNTATLRIGQRFPILNATFAPIFNTGALSQVIQGGNFIAPFPSFSYEDLGITVKATPQVHMDEVTLKLEVDIRTLSAQSFNGVPVISNRAYAGAVRVKDGEIGGVAGTLERSQQNVTTGIPGISQIPGLGSLLSTHSREQRDSELLILIRPRIVRLLPTTGEELVLRTNP
jgi:type II secretory pathway component GspD/PulD (secretin)